MQCDAILNDEDPDVKSRWCASLSLECLQRRENSTRDTLYERVYGDHSKSASARDCERQPQIGAMFAQLLWFDGRLL